MCNCACMYSTSREIHYLSQNSKDYVIVIPRKKDFIHNQPTHISSKSLELASKMILFHKKM